MDQQIKQRVCGLLGGLAYVSTADYYNQMNQLVGKLHPGHSSRIHIVSLDIFNYVDLLTKNQLTDAVEYLLSGIHELLKSSVDFIVICSNTAHISVPRIMEYYPNIVLLHISDAVAFSIKKRNLKKIGFIGTKFAMLPTSCVVKRLVEHDLSIVFPNEQEIERIHQIIIDELSNNIFTKESKDFYIKTIQRIYDEEKLEGFILGCTEIPLLVNQTDMPHIPLFDSTQLHVQLAVDYQLDRVRIEEFLPSKTN